MSHTTYLYSQVDRSGKAVKLDKDGFPELASLDLEQDQQQLRYEAYQALAAEQAKYAPIAADGFPEQNPAKVQAWQQEQSSSSRTPFASSRPRTDDRYRLDE